MKRMLLSFALAATAIFGTPTPVADAQSWKQNFRSEQAGVPLSTVFRQLKRRYGGTQLSARQSGGKYHIRWLTDKGRALNIVVDAKTGKILSTSGA
ncbi:MAG: hypothetical protein AAFX02_07735 [Pseudomonadota bacterium]